MEHLLPFEKIKREILIKEEEATDEALGCAPEKRKTEEIINYGVVNINKPQGPTSHQVSDYVQKILNISKAGHSGTLDPNVHGVLPTALGRATRVVQVLLTAGKEYVGIMHLHKDIDEKKLNETIKNNFFGKIRQKPPLKSSVRRIERTREIYYFDILEKDEKDALFIVGCQAGTYIRKLIHDLGKKLKIGAHMQELRRTKAGPFDEKAIFSMQDLIDAYHFYKSENHENQGLSGCQKSSIFVHNEKFLRKVIQPVEKAVDHLPKIWVFDSCVDSICHGANLNIPGISKLNDKIIQDDTVAIMTLKNELVALGNAQLSSEQILREKKGFAVKTDKVFMLPDTYKLA